MERTPDSLIPYDEMVQDSLLEVVKKAMKFLENSNGVLPGNHHFYISFKSHAPGVVIPDHLKKKFPDELAIVLQHKFFNLKTDNEKFSVDLSFNNVPGRVTVPYKAITSFNDPSVDFGLAFNVIIPKTQEHMKSDDQGEGQGNVIQVNFDRKG